MRASQLDWQFKDDVKDQELGQQWSALSAKDQAAIALAYARAVIKAVKTRAGARAAQEGRSDEPS